MIKKNKIKYEKNKNCWCVWDIGIGKMKMISISKTRKIKVIRKNRRENGERSLKNLKNPHSNELSLW